MGNVVFLRIQKLRHDKTNKVTVRPAKTRISLGICPVWSESLLSAWRKLWSLATHWVHSEDSDQTGRMPRLIWVFAGCSHFVSFVMSWLTMLSVWLYRKVWKIETHKSIAVIILKFTKKLFIYHSVQKMQLESPEKKATQIHWNFHWNFQWHSAIKFCLFLRQYTVQQNWTDNNLPVRILSIRNYGNLYRYKPGKFAGVY